VYETQLGIGGSDETDGGETVPRRKKFEGRMDVVKRRGTLTPPPEKEGVMTLFPWVLVVSKM